MTKRPTIYPDSGGPTLPRAAIPLLILVLICATMLSPTEVDAVTQIETAYGGQSAFYLPRINAMAGTGTALYRGGMSNIFNPATLVKETEGRLDLALAVENQMEDRFQPLFDTFDSYVTDASIASNRDNFWYGGGGLAGRLGGGAIPVVLALSLAPRYPFSYRFEEEIRNPSPDASEHRDQIEQNRQREVSGILRNLSAGVGVGLHDIVSVGLSIHYAYGTRTDQVGVRNYVEPDSSYYQEETFELEGANATLGALIRLTKRVELGLAYETKLSTAGDRTVISESSLDTMQASRREGIEYPDYFRGGLAFYPRTDPRTVFVLGLEYARWSELRDTRVAGEDPKLHDTWDFRVAVQHTFHNGAPLRFGFRRFDSYAEKEVGTSVYSIGSGLRILTGLLSVSVELSKTVANLEHHFDYPPDYSGGNLYTDPQARVETTQFRVGAGYSIQF